MVNLTAKIEKDIYPENLTHDLTIPVYKEPVFNYNLDFMFLWDEIELPLTHESNYKEADEINYRENHQQNRNY